MPIVLASPWEPSPEDSGMSSIPMTWTGVDGVVWDLGDPYNATPFMASGVTGLHMPRAQMFESSTPLVPGVDLEGYNLLPRKVYWPLIFEADSTTAWRTAYSAFFDSMHPIETGTWTVGTGEEARSLPLVGVFDDDYAFIDDPFDSGMALIGVELRAPKPLWRGVTVEQKFGGDQGQPFIRTERAPAFHLSPAASFHTASIRNPGNEPAYLRWVAEGPLTDLRMGIGGAVIEVPFPIAEGQTLVVDTDPAGQYATLNGIDSTRALGFQMFAPVPSGGASRLTISAAGAGSVTAELVPLYWRGV